MTLKRLMLFREDTFGRDDQLLRWYLRHSLSYCDLDEMMAERSLAEDHVTIWRRV